MNIKVYCTRSGSYNTTDIKISSEISTLKESPEKQTPQTSSKFPQKKQKWTKEKRKL